MSVGGSKWPGAALGMMPDEQHGGLAGASCNERKVAVLRAREYQVASAIQEARSEATIVATKGPNAVVVLGTDEAVAAVAKTPPDSKP